MPENRKRAPVLFNACLNLIVRNNFIAKNAWSFGRTNSPHVQREQPAFSLTLVNMGLCTYSVASSPTAQHHRNRQQFLLGKCYRLLHLGDVEN